MCIIGVDTTKSNKTSRLLSLIIFRRETLEKQTTTKKGGRGIATDFGDRRGREKVRERE